MSSKTKGERYRLGRVWEREVFGRSGDEFPEPEYLPFGEAVEDVKRTQRERGWNPENPHTTIGSELLACVRGSLPPTLEKKVRFYCAIGSSLDWHHGADGFFTIGTFVVTVDLSYREKKDRKADVLFPHSKANLMLWRVGKEVADRIKVGYFAPPPKPDAY